MKPEFLMLAKKYSPGCIALRGWWLSEKLDGIRAFWDGGVSRGIRASEIPYANTVKDSRLKNRVIATGLWSRTGKVIHAPSYWLNGLPNRMLDGELWLGRRQFQSLISTVSTKDGSKDDYWSAVRYMVFDSPAPQVVFCPRTIKVRDYEYNINSPSLAYSQVTPFTGTYAMMSRINLGRAELHSQELLDTNSLDYLTQELNRLLEIGAEGIMLRRADSYWVAQRSNNLLKYKPWHDAEGTLVGFTSGKETNKGSRLLGKIGALILDYKGKRLELSGLTDDEREFWISYESGYAEDHPGEDMPSSFLGVHFKVGDVITFKYRELSDAGIPKEARYWRKA